MDNGSMFKNRERLLSHGETCLRGHALDILETGIRSAVPYHSAKRLVRYENGALHVGGDSYPAAGRIYVVGAGKGSFPIAQALEEILGGRISRGVVVVKEGETRRLSHIEVFESSHPFPDERSVAAAHKMLDILNEAGEGDIVLAAITGGSSALVNLPAGDISIDDLREVSRLLLSCGASIGKINAVRKHLCRMKGGQVVQKGQPATVITLTLDTAPPDMPWPDMCLPDPTTFRDAVEVLEAYGLWDKVAEPVRRRLQEGLERPELETVKSIEGMNWALYPLASPASACESAAKRAGELGYTPHILSTALEGEAKDLGIFMAGLANEIQSRGRPFQPPCALISGGETTVTIGSDWGRGGPNQESVLGFASKLRAQRGAVFASVDTDGTDGPCDMAGGIVDGATMARLAEQRLDLNAALLGHNTLELLEQLGDALDTGHTGTNVMNLRVVLIEKGVSAEWAT